MYAVSMRFVTLTGVGILALVSIISAGERPKELDELQGTWKVSELVIAGKPVICGDGYPLSFVIQGNQLSYMGLVVNGQPLRVDMTIALGSESALNTIDGTLLAGNSAGKTCPGIYKLEGESLIVCLPDNPTHDRPTDFKVEGDPGLLLFKLQRSEPQ